MFGEKRVDRRTGGGEPDGKWHEHAEGKEEAEEGEEVALDVASAAAQL
jgi:hypothetical protein